MPTDSQDDIQEHAVSPSDPRATSGSEYRALGVVAILAALVCISLAVPVGSGILVGALVAFTMRPLHVELRKRTGRNRLAAAVCAALAFLALTGGLGGLLYVLIGRGAGLAREVPAAVAPGGPVERLLDQVSQRASVLGVSSETLNQHLQHAAEQSASYAAGFAGRAMSLVFATTLALFFTVVTVYTVLSHWARLTHWTEVLLPLRPLQTRQLLDRMRLLGREIILGTLLVGLTQGLLAGVAYAVLGVPQAAFFGAMTAVASPIPAFGTMLVWAPLGAYMIATGHAGAGIGILVWGTLVVVGLSDGFLRPRVVGSRSNMGLLPALIGLFGGVELFGFIGLLLGPALMGMGLAVLRLYADGRGHFHATRELPAGQRPHLAGNGVGDAIRLPPGGERGRATVAATRGSGA